LVTLFLILLQALGQHLSLLINKGKALASRLIKERWDDQKPSWRNPWLTASKILSGIYLYRRVIKIWDVKSTSKPIPRENQTNHHSLIKCIQSIIWNILFTINPCFETAILSNSISTKMLSVRTKVYSRSGYKTIKPSIFAGGELIN
jgi:hypothetical protein